MKSLALLRTLAGPACGLALLASLSALTACAADADDDYPVLPGGFSPPSTALPAPGMVSGRVCIIDDPRNLGACSTASTGALDVTLGGARTTTAMDGSFSLAAQTSAGPMFQISGPGIVTTQAPFSSTATIPVLRAELFDQMMRANGITPSGGAGSILGRVLRDGVPVSGVTVTARPAPAFGPLFDGGSPTAWRLDATGARGVIWVPGVALGPTQLTFRDLATSGETTVDGVQVVNGGITILDAVLP